jgi:hypothetical protein
MVTMPSTDIHTIKEEIKRCELRIESLESQLKDAQAERQRWERQLEFATTKELDYFNKCPVETIIEIFQIYLTFGHRHIRTLLLVCKDWYELVMKSPSLWNRIDLHFPKTSIGQTFGLIPYVQACKRRSEDLKLDISLNLRNIGDLRYYHCEVVDSSLPEECNNCLNHLLSEGGYGRECPLFEQRIWEVVRILQALAGDSSKDTARWSSFSIAPPEQEFRTMGPCFSWDGPMDSLVSISLEDSEGWYYFPSDDNFDRFPGPKDWSHVERLTTKIDLNLLPIQWSSIKHLDIKVQNRNELSNISKLTSLETLVINTPTNKYDLDLFRQRNVHLCFPSLHSMDIIGLLPNDWSKAFKFDTPSLRNFSVQLCSTNYYSTNHFDMNFPQISPWSVTLKDKDAYDDDIKYYGVWDNTEREKAVRQVLHHFSSAEQIIFWGFKDEMVRIALLDRLSNGQQCPNSVYTEKNGDFSRLHHSATI